MNRSGTTGENRRLLVRSLSGGVFVACANTSLQRRSDTPYSFEQESHFFYITGIRDPDWWVIINIATNQSWLVAPEIGKTHRIFDGSLSWEDARRISGIEDVISQPEAKSLLVDLAKKHKTVHTLGADPREKQYNFVVNPAQAKMRTLLKKIFMNVADCRQELTKLRAIKQSEELIALKEAVSLTVSAFTQTKGSLATATNEYEVEAELTYFFRRHGAEGHAYDPIVASGKNALTLHYIKNNDRLPKNGLILIDAGARVNGYCADITRTYAIGTPTDRQKAVHAAVETAHHAIIALLGPEKSVKEYHEEVDAIMIEALKSLDLYRKPADYRKYFPHAISHGLGIDVHDSLGRPTHFKPGMVLTVEPGIYIPEEGIGVRIEDDILITDTGSENLTGALATSL